MEVKSEKNISAPESTPANDDVLLDVKDLRVSFFTPVGEVKAVDGISYSLKSNEVMGIVGESGSGKSVEAYAIMGLLQSPGKVIGGTVHFEGDNVLDYDKKQYTAFRGNKISMIFQNPMTCLNPVYTIGDQLMEALTCHNKDIEKDEKAENNAKDEGKKKTEITKEEAWKRAVEMLEFVGINNAERRMKQYPHEFSGGMRQRAMIAMALICKPKLLIADEPTTALDVTIQAQIIDLMKHLQEETGMSIIFITHNLGVVAEICDKVSVMYAGHIMEQGPVNEIFYNPAHPYTQGLLASMPRLDEETHERLIPIEGTPVDLLDPPTGCSFGPRCEHCMKICTSKMPPLIDVDGEGHKAACWLHVKNAFANKSKEGAQTNE